MSPEPKVQLLCDGTQLNIDCEQPEFDRVKQAVCTAISCGENVDQVTQINITDLSQWQTEPERGCRDRIALVGCALVISGIVIVFVIGIFQIVGLFQK